MIVIKSQKTRLLIEIKSVEARLRKFQSGMRTVLEIEVEDINNIF